MDLKRIDAAIASYAESGDKGLTKRLEFFRGVWEIQSRYAQQATDTAAELDAEDLERWYWDDMPLLAQAPCRIDVDTFAAAADELAGYFAEHGSFDSDVVETLSAMDWSAFLKATPVDLAGSNPMAYLDQVMAYAEDTIPALRTDFIVMVLSLALRAMLDTYVQGIFTKIQKNLSKHTQLHAHHADCPICGGQATIAVVGKTDSGDGNTRTMWCSQCGGTWEYFRIGCSHCGCRTQEHLHYTSIEGDDRHRLYHCDECRGYLRTMFDMANATDDSVTAQLMRKPFSFEVEDVVMAPLNMVAFDLLSHE